MTDPESSLWARYYQDMPVPAAWNATIELLLAHRSIRHYLPDPLPDGVLQAMMAAAQSASTSSNLQLWSGIAVEDNARKARLAQLAGHQRHVAEAPLVLAWLVDLARLRCLADARGEVSEGLDYMEGFLLAAVDVALAAQNAVVALESLGLGCCYIGGFRNKPLEVGVELGLPPHVFALFGMTVGKPDPAHSAQVKPRLPQDIPLMRERYVWGEAQCESIAAYDEKMRAFQRDTGMKEQDWTAQAARRVRNASALTGRDVLREILHRFGFELR
jgi:nitroreductase